MATIIAILSRALPKYGTALIITSIFIAVATLALSVSREIQNNIAAMQSECSSIYSPIASIENIKERVRRNQTVDMFAPVRGEVELAFRYHNRTGATSNIDNELYLHNQMIRFLPEITGRVGNDYDQYYTRSMLVLNEIEELGCTLEWRAAPVGENVCRCHLISERLF